MGVSQQDEPDIPKQIVLAHELPFTLGVLAIEPATRQVALDGRSETVEPRVMQVLVALARANGAIVTRDELVERCWDGRIVGDDAINRALSRCRQIASGIGAGSFAIETVPRVGYRLTDPEGERPANAARGMPSICVLPFVNMSGDPEQEYFSDGISEDITTDLSKVSALAVTARNTAFTFKGHAVDVREVARKLGVSHVLEGSVRKVGNRVRISAQLIDGTTGDHVWAERYDRDLTDIFAIQDELSEAIVRALKLELLPQQRKAIERRGTASAEAYDFYLTAHRYWITGSHGERRREEKVVRLCQRAIEIDPDYAQAWALMALGQSNLFRSYSDNRTLADGAAAAERALALNPGIAEAHLPKAWHFAEQGQQDQANAELAIALELGPDSWEVNKETARIFWRQRRVADAARCLETATGLVDSDYHSWGMLAACEMALGNSRGLKRCARKISDQVQSILAQDPDNGSALAFGALALAVLGEPEQARAWQERALLLDGGNLYMRYNLAWPLLTIWQEKDAALAMLEPCLTDGGSKLVSLAATDQNLDGLRGQARFEQLLAAANARVGLSPDAFAGPATP